MSNFIDFELFHIGDYSIKVYSLLVVLMILVATKLTLWLIKITINKKLKDKTNDNHGNIFALYQLIKYFLWIISIGLILQTIGMKITVLIAGSAALLVGVGLGLQQTFNDIISGIILLSERSIRIGDILEIDGDIIKIQNIGLRTSKGLNRDDISIIIPNSQITTNKVINWSHQSKHTRFKIDIGVSYGSDIDTVIKILKDSTMDHNDISDKKLIDVRLANFGESALEFQILFYSNNIFRIEKVKSEIRQTISKNFKKNNITIPFPQLDLHLKSGNV